MPKPKKSFSARMGGNSAGAEITKFETGGGAVGFEITPGGRDERDEQKAASAPAIEKAKPASRAAKEAAPAAQGPLVLMPAAAMPPVSYDFRNLKEPEKTLRRVEAVLSDSRFTHGERAACALLALAFMNGPDTRTLSVKKLLSESRGFSAKVRNTFLAHMTEAGLISVSFVRGVGSEITLLF